MKRPWQIWILYALCLAVAVPAMVWLSVKACELDRAEAEARQQAESARAQAEDARRREEAARRRAELEEDVSLALWRMDTWLAPLIAKEAARPHFVYRPYYSLPGKAKLVKGGGEAISRQASPLLMQPSDYVVLNFQLSPDNTITSPQAPPLELNPWAVENGTTLANIDVSNSRLNEFKPNVDVQQLWSRLPEQTLPRVELDEYAWNANALAANAQPGQSTRFSSVDNYGLGQRAQFEQQQIVQQEVAPQQPTPRSVGPDPANAPQSPEAQNKIQRYLNSRDPQTQVARGGNEYHRRNRVLQDFNQEVFSQQRQGIPKIFTETLVSEGVSRPLWIGPCLVLARRVTVGDKELVQGAWLDWEKIKTALLDQIADLLPDATLVRVFGDAEMDPTRMLAALPLRLVVPDSPEVLLTAAALPGAVAQVSPMRISLWVAWGCLALAAVAVAVVLLGVVSLSERRAAFVASVTHELRTPLTTFRMYAEMLSEGMVPNEARRQSYLQTLRAEAERLTHLVSNVLSYARLERGRPGGRREEVALGELAGHVRNRLADRAEQADMELVVEVEPADEKHVLRTDPAAVEQVLFNLVDNACKYASGADDKRVHLSIATRDNTAQFRVRDHGPGISSQARRRLFIPFSKSVHDAANTAPGVGLGLALCRRLSRALGGRLDVEPSNADGTTFVLHLPLA